MSVPNGRTRIIYYLLAFIQASGFLIVGYWVGRIERVEAKIANHEEMASAQWMHFEGRLSKAEANYEEILRRLDHIDKAVDR